MKLVIFMGNEEVATGEMNPKSPEIQSLINATVGLDNPAIDKNIDYQLNTEGSILNQFKKEFQEVYPETFESVMGNTPSIRGRAPGFDSFAAAYISSVVALWSANDDPSHKEESEKLISAEPDLFDANLRDMVTAGGKMNTLTLPSKPDSFAAIIKDQSVQVSAMIQTMLLSQNVMINAAFTEANEMAYKFANENDMSMFFDIGVNPDKNTGIVPDSAEPFQVPGAEKLEK